ncbi:MAG: LEA type 2 family protein [Alkalispirochaeta sp.]
MVVRPLLFRRPPARRLATIFATIFVILTAALTGCSSFRAAVEPVPPEVEVQDIRLTSLDFSAATLEVDLLVINRNPLGVSVAGFTYGFEVEGFTLVEGEQLGGVDIAAKGESVVTVPITFTFRDLQESVAAVRTQNEIAYAVLSDVSVDIPILGRRTISVRKDGRMAVPRLPRPALKGITVTAVGLTGAELVAAVEVENPNAFTVTLENVYYQLIVDDTEWVSGRPAQRIVLAPEEATTLPVPFTLRVLDIGRSAYRVLTQGGPVSYRLEFDATVGTDHPLLPSVDMPFVQSGKVDLLR